MLIVVLGLFFYCTVLYKYINKRAGELRYVEFLSPFHTFSTCKTIYILQAFLFLEHVQGKPKILFMFLNNSFIITIYTSLAEPVYLYLIGLLKGLFERTKYISLMLNLILKLIFIVFYINFSYLFTGLRKVPRCI